MSLRAQVQKKTRLLSFSVLTRKGSWEARPPLELRSTESVSWANWPDPELEKEKENGQKEKETRRMRCFFLER